MLKLLYSIIIQLFDIYYINIFQLQVILCILIVKKNVIFSLCALACSCVGCSCGPCSFRYQYFKHVPNFCLFQRGVESSAEAWSEGGSKRKFTRKYRKIQE